ncbi:MAG: signal peptidase I [Candidatus Acidiferrales bacterium]
MKAENAARARKKAPAGNRVQHEIVGWLWVALAFFFINGTLVQARVIPSGSMERTLLIGDHLIMSRFGYDAGIPFTHWHVPLWRNPHFGQIVIFRPPADPEGSDLVKRVIGMPGDRLRIVNQQVFVNGKPLNEPYAVRGPAVGRDSIGDNFPSPAGPALSYGMTPEWAERLPNYVRGGELIVPAGEYFMMGDNRNDSYDSRFWGFVPRSSIIGTPVIIYMSISGPEEAWQGQIGGRLYAYANALIHPRLVRWGRIFSTF